jgi:hypothetical protein
MTPGLASQADERVGITEQSALSSDVTKFKNSGLSARYHRNGTVAKVALGRIE